MKKYFLSGIAMLIVSLAFAQKEKGMVTIKGTLNGDLKGYNKIYMYTRTSNDSTEIKDGKYTFSFPFTEAMIKILYPEYIKEMRMMYQPFGVLIAESGTYYITSDIEKTMSKSSVVKGPESAVLYRQFESGQNEAYRNISLGMEKIYGDKWYSIEEKDPRYIASKNSNDSLVEVFIFPLINNLIKKHPDSYASAYVLGGAGKSIASMEKKEHLFGMLSSRMQKSEMGKKFADYIQGIKSSGIGNMVNNFVLPDPQDKNVDFSSLRGKYVLIDFWASWCSPCRQSFPHMREVYKTYKNDNFEIYSISIDESKEAWLKAVKEENNPWLQSLDTKNISQSGFAVTGVPSTFLIDPQGKIVAKEVGFDEKGGSEIEKKLGELFHQKATLKANAEKENKTNVIKSIPMTGMGN